MRISWKSFFVSFGVAILLFSLILTCICMHVFDKFVPKAERNPSVIATPPTYEYESYLFYCNDKEDEALDFAVLVRIKEQEKKLLVTLMNGDDLIERQGMFFYVRSLCQTNGVSELSPIFAVLTGCKVEKGRILNAREYFPDAIQDSTVTYLDFLEVLPNVWEKTKDGFGVVEHPLQAEENQGIRILNVEKSLDAFLLK